MTGVFLWHVPPSASSSANFSRRFTQRKVWKTSGHIFLMNRCKFSEKFFSLDLNLAKHEASLEHGLFPYPKGTWHLFTKEYGILGFSAKISHMGVLTKNHYVLNIWYCYSNCEVLMTEPVAGAVFETLKSSVIAFK